MNTAAEFFSWQESLSETSSRNESVKKFRSLPREERLKVLLERRDKDKFFLPENANSENKREHTSPSGRWRLVTTPYGTKPNSWNYTLGELYRCTLGEVYSLSNPQEQGSFKITEVRRNYSSFWFAWVENHKVTGQDYLITGEDYQGFTIVNLTTGTVQSFIPDEAYEGHGWCPVTAELLPDVVTLKVSGCYWACPYEVRLYDFSNPDDPAFPLNGLPNLTEDLWFDEDEGTTLTVDESDGSVTLTQHRKRFKATGEWEHDVESKRTLLHERAHKAKKAGDAAEVARVKQEEEELGALYYPEDDDEEEAAWEKVPYTRDFYVRSQETGKYKEVPERKWKSEYALQNDKKREEYEEKAKKEFQHYRDTEPLYLEAMTAFPNDYLQRTGKMHQSLVQKWDGDENPFHFHFRVDERSENERPERTANLVWGAVDGPVKAECWTYGKGTTTTFFPRSEHGWKRALDHAKKHLEGLSPAP